MQAQHLVSIVICTKNRANFLRGALNVLNEIVIPADVRLEVVIIDNGSTDDTRAVAESARLTRAPIRYFLEELPGTGHARNRGVREAAGDIVLFIDDDVVPSVNWLEGICRPILDNQADVVVGGVNLPAELRQKIPFAHSWFASTEGINLQSPERFVTANVALSTRVFEVIPGFDTELGAGTELGAAEDTLLAYQIIEAGLRMVSRFEASVDHRFEVNRIERKRILHMCGRIARSAAYIDRHWKHIGCQWNAFQDLKLFLGLWLRRTLFFVDCYVLQKPLDWEVLRIYEVEYRRQYRIEARKARKYALRGLVKLNSATPLCTINK